MLEELKQSMITGICRFSYVKSDGTKRFAWGTTNKALIPKYREEDVAKLIEASSFLSGVVSNTIKSSGGRCQNMADFEPAMEMAEKSLKPFMPKEAKNRKINEDLVTYYDFESKAWRSFKKGSLVSVG